MIWHVKNLCKLWWKLHWKLENVVITFYGTVSNIKTLMFFFLFFLFFLERYKFAFILGDIVLGKVTMHICQGNEKFIFQDFGMGIFKAISKFDQGWKMLPFIFSIIKIKIWPWLSPFFKSSVYLYWLLYIKLKYAEYSFSYTILQY